MIPILFPYNATEFTTHGIGDLTEAMRCESTVNSEGEYELELEYPADGFYTSQLIIDNIIVAKVNDHGSNQAFRIYGIEKTINSSILVHAQHISYDLANLIVQNYKATTCVQAVAGLSYNLINQDTFGFNFYTDVTAPAQNVDHEFKLDEPSTLRAALLDGDSSIKGTFGGDLIFDNHNVSLLSVGGADRGVLVEYGIDMIDMSQEENISEMVTGVYPFWRGKPGQSDPEYEYWDDMHPDGDDMFIYGDVQYATGTFKRQRIIPLNINEYWVEDNHPTKSMVNSIAQDWIAANEIGQPEINLTVSYADLKKNKNVRLHDAITVRFVKIGIDVKAKVVSYKYDTLRERCIEIEVGKAKPSILFDLEDASRLKRGLIPPKRIQNKSIGSDQLSNSAVGSAQLGSNSVSNWHLKDSSVTSNKIGQFEVKEYNLGPLSVTEGKIKDGAVTDQKIGENEIKAKHIKDGEIVEAKLGDASVTSLKIKDGAVIEAKVGNAAITTDKVKDLAINSAKIGNSAITSAKIKDGEVVEAKIGNSAITAKKIANLAVEEAKIGNSAITSAKIKDGSVVKGKIGNNAIYFENIAEAQIDTLNLNDFSITSTKVPIDGGYHYNLKTKKWEQTAAPIDTGNLVDGAVDEDKIMDYAVVEMKIADYNVATIKLAQDGQDAIAAVWYIDELVTNNIDSTGINSGYATISGNAEVSGSLIASSVVTDSLVLGGSRVGTVTQDGITYLIL